MKNKYEYRGQLKSGKIVDIFNFEGLMASCDHGDGEIHIDDFNCIFCPTEKFKEIMGLNTEEVVDEEIFPKRKVKNVSE